MASGNTSRTRREELRIESHATDGWEVATETPALGDAVMTVQGKAEVVRILGKVSDGSRLLELRLVNQEGPSYFAATTNVLQRRAR